MAATISPLLRHSSYYEEVALHHAVSAATTTTTSTPTTYVDSFIGMDENSSSIKYGAAVCMQHCFDYHNYYDHSTTNTNFSSWLTFWCKAIIRKVFLKYLSHPIYLFVLPLCIGIMLGWILATMTTKTKAATFPGRKSANNSNSTSSIKTFCHCVFSCLCLLVQTALEFSSWIISIINPRKLSLKEKEALARSEASSTEDKMYESKVPRHQIPKHIAVIMDGNRRYGRAKYGIATKGHWDGSKKLCDFARWCQCEGVQILTVYAFSTENWDRDPAEIETLMEIIVQYCDEILEKAVERQMKVQVLSTETYRIPQKVKEGIKRLVDGTAHCNQFLLNICLSYGGRGEIVNVCKTICTDVQNGGIDIGDVNEEYFSKQISGSSPDPDILIRTSGEMRLSNFQLWQLAYTELFFLKFQWPEIEKKHLIDVIQKFANGRSRRYGK